MSIYLFGITAANAILPEIEADERLGSLYGIAEGDLQAVVASLSDGINIDWMRNVNQAELMLWALRHEYCVNSIVACTSVLPAPFGTLLADETAVRTLLMQQAAQFGKLLTAIANHAEYTLTVTLDASLSESLIAQSVPEGVNYLLRKKHLQQARTAYLTERDTLMEHLHAVCSSGARQSVLLTSPGGAALHSAYLLPRDQVTRLLEALHLLNVPDDVLVRFEGPFAPYHFMDELW